MVGLERNILSVSKGVCTVYSAQPGDNEGDNKSQAGTCKVCFETEIPNIQAQPKTTPWQTGLLLAARRVLKVVAAAHKVFITLRRQCWAKTDAQEAKKGPVMWSREAVMWSSSKVWIFGAFSEHFHHLLRIQSNLRKLEPNPITALLFLTWPL